MKRLSTILIPLVGILLLTGVFCARIDLRPNQNQKETKNMAVPLPAPSPLPDGGASYGMTAPETYSYSPNGTGGVNYFKGTTPITNTEFGTATGNDYKQIEANVAAQYTGGGTSTDSGTTSSTQNTGTVLGEKTQAQLDAEQKAATLNALMTQKGSILDSESLRR